MAEEFGLGGFLVVVVLVAGGVDVGDVGGTDLRRVVCGGRGVGCLGGMVW